MSVENVLKSAVENNDVPFVVAMAGNAAGITCSGRQVTRPKIAQQPKTRCFVSFL